MPRSRLSLLLLLCALLCGCQRGGQANARQATAFPLPSSWPLAVIQVPEQSQPAELPGAFPSDEGDPFMSTAQPFNQRSRNSGKMWSVAYTTGLSWEEQLAQFSSQHEELLYQLNWDKPLTREFISPDGLYITQIHLDVQSGVSVLSIFAYDESWPGARPFGT